VAGCSHLGWLRGWRAIADCSAGWTTSRHCMLSAETAHHAGAGGHAVAHCTVLRRGID